MFGCFTFQKLLISFHPNHFFSSDFFTTVIFMTVLRLFLKTLIIYALAPGTRPPTPFLTILLSKANKMVKKGVGVVEFSTLMILHEKKINIVKKTNDRWLIR